MKRVSIKSRQTRRQKGLSFGDWLRWCFFLAMIMSFIPFPFLWSWYNNDTSKIFPTLWFLYPSNALQNILVLWLWNDSYLYNLGFALILFVGILGAVLAPIVKSSAFSLFVFWLFEDVKHINVVVFLWAIGLVLLIYPPFHLIFLPWPISADIMTYLEYKLFGVGTLPWFKIFLIALLIVYLFAFPIGRVTIPIEKRLAQFSERRRKDQKRKLVLKIVEEQEVETGQKQGGGEEVLSRGSEGKSSQRKKRKKVSMDREIIFDVALSFAGEQREYVEDVFLLLHKKGVKVFYDESFKVSTWGKDLSEYLMNVYYRQSRYCIMFISKEYVSKAWPTFERRNAIARFIEGHSDYILPVRFDDSEVPGLPSTIGYIDAKENTPENIVNLFMSKLKDQQQG